MFEIFRAGGPLMWLILICSVVALTIVLERFFYLQKKKILPLSIKEQIKQLVNNYQAKNNQINSEKLLILENHSALGAIYASGLKNIQFGEESMKESMQEAGKQVVHKLNKYLNTLGTIASITPLLGLLGTVIGMIKVFTAITAHGVGDPTVLSSGISEALITTAAGLSVGIPCLMFHRYFKSKITELTMLLEDQAVSFLETVKLGSGKA